MFYIKKESCHIKNRLLNHAVHIEKNETNFTYETCIKKIDYTLYENKTFPGIKEYGTKKNNVKEKNVQNNISFYNVCKKQYIEDKKSLQDEKCFISKKTDLFNDFDMIKILDTVLDNTEKKSTIYNSNLFSYFRTLQIYEAIHTNHHMFFDEMQYLFNFTTNLNYLERLKENNDIEDWILNWIEKRIGVQYNPHSLNIIHFMQWADKNEWRFKEKCYKINFITMLEKQEKWLKKSQRNSGNPQDFISLFSIENMKWGEILTPEGLDYEGSIMHHCVGLGGYDIRDTKIFSLRDEENIPYVTMEYNPNNQEIIQIRGFKNGSVEKYDKFIKPFINKIRE